MTAAEAAEWGKTLSFEKVWTMFAETDRKFAESRAEADRKFAESRAETDRKFAETDRLIKKLSRNIGGVNNTLGKWSEEMVAANICEKMNRYNYEFTQCARNKQYFEGGKKVAEVDCFLENGDFVMVVEVKTTLTESNVKRHIERIEKVRRCMDIRSDNRTILGAVAAAIVSTDVCEYAQENGLYVLVQSGRSIAVADTPETFNARKWVA
jgi:hypothetical protein